MKFLFTSFGIWSFTILCLIVFGRRERLCSVAGGLGVISGSLFAIASGVTTLLSNSYECFYLNWNYIGDKISFALDPLAAWFVIPVCGLSLLAAIYAIAYDWDNETGYSKSFSWILFILLLASMVLVICAANGVVFLMAWEVMAVSSFFLVIRDSAHSHSSQDAGWIYLIATHLGTVFLVILFLLAQAQTGSFDFMVWEKQGLNIPNRSLLFLLAAIGFGTKAGFVPFHIWLPEAHPAAPSYISAVMSGVMIKTGIYGLIRSIGWFGAPIPHWWGIAVLVIGIVSGVLGVLFAIAQHDLKRLLAYHSVENIGIITIGIGVGLVGLSYDNAGLIFLGFSGAVLHVLNHAVFKGLLFLGAGSVLHSTEEREIDKMGGLLKRMPLTGVAFLIGAMAISGLPPLNGFVSELIIFISGVHSLLSKDVTIGLCGAAVVGGLALIGGLAAACFAKAFGIIFVGEPRSDKCSKAEESSPLMTIPMLVLAMLCLVIGLSGAWLVAGVAPQIVQNISKNTSLDFAGYQSQLSNALMFVGLTGGLLIVLLALFVLIKKALIKNRTVSYGLTWDCGYTRPTARMQYTASSFAQPFLELFKPILRTRHHYHVHMPDNMFPQGANFHTETPDICHTEVYRPVFLKISEILMKFRFLQHGYIQIYILYIALTLILLLIWKIR